MIGAIQPAYSSETDVVNICDVVAHGPEFHDKRIHLQLVYMTDFRHIFFFKQPKRPDVSTDRLEPREHWQIAEDLKRGNATVRELDNAMQKDLNDRIFNSAPDGEFVVEATGVFTWNENWRPPPLLSAVVKPAPHGQFLIEDVLSFKKAVGDWTAAFGK